MTSPTYTNSSTPTDSTTDPATPPVAAAMNLANTTPLDEDSAEGSALLAGLQGNILKGHGRDFGAYIFFSFSSDMTVAKLQLKDLADRYVTSAARQLQESKEFKEFGVPGGLFGNLSLSASGLSKLGLLGGIPDEGPETISNTLSNFAEGMKAHAVADFNDPAIDQWERGFQEDSDAMLLLADDDEGFLLRAAREALDVIQLSGRIVVVEHGKALRNLQGEGIEHFGYVDGRSQPLYLKSDFVHDGAGTRLGERLGGKTGAIGNWDPFEPLSRVLVRDPLVADDGISHGSFLVFRKLEQNVLHFKIREIDLADELGFTGDERERAGAMAVGRFEDGTPVTLSKTDGFQPSQENDFNYSGDAAGAKCPFHAHIRKSNPRGDIRREFGTPDDEAERSRRITRRGIPFGERSAHPDAFQDINELPTEGVGLLFMCYQAKIRQQFAFMQRSWCNNQNFVRPATGLDPIIGMRNPGNTTVLNWPTTYGGPTVKPFGFEGFVHMKGGEFLYTPSMKFFSDLP